MNANRFRIPADGEDSPDLEAPLIERLKAVAIGSFHTFEQAQVLRSEFVAQEALNLPL